jgi:hypothetical protein
LRAILSPLESTDNFATGDDSGSPHGNRHDLGFATKDATSEVAMGPAANQVGQASSLSLPHPPATSAQTTGHRRLAIGDFRFFPFAPPKSPSGCHICGSAIKKPNQAL